MATGETSEVFDFDLEFLLHSKNIAEEMTEEERNKIARDVVKAYETDLNTRSNWEKANKKAREFAQLIEKPRQYEPYRGAINVMLPVIAKSVVQFAGRMVKHIIPTDQVVKGKVVGGDKSGQESDVARRLGEHMSHVMLEEIPGWKSGLDKLATDAPICGSGFRKTFYDSIKRCIYSDYVPSQDLVFDQDHLFFDDVDRKTHVYTFSHNKVVEKQRAGLFLSFKDKKGVDITRQILGKTRPDDKDEPYIFLEQHASLDLDGDDYEEPYIITVEKNSITLLRIYRRFDEQDIIRSDEIDVDETSSEGAVQVVRINPIEMFTPFLFMVDPDGSLYGIAFGRLQAGLNQLANSLCNIIVDAGAFAALPPAIIRKGALAIAESEIVLEPGKITPVEMRSDDIRRDIYVFEIAGPVTALLTLLSIALDASEKIGSPDVLSGVSRGSEEPVGTIMTKLEQGLQVLSGVFGRFHDSLKQEFAKILELMKRHMPERLEYLRLQRDEGEIGQWDEDIQPIPVSDPNAITDIHRLMVADELLKMKQAGLPLDTEKITRRRLEALRVSDYQDLLSPKETQPPPDPKMIAEMAKVKNDAARLELERMQEVRAAHETAMKLAKQQAEIDKIRAEIIVKKADAEAAGRKEEAEEFKLFLQGMTDSRRFALEQQKLLVGEIRGRE